MKDDESGVGLTGAGGRIATAAAAVSGRTWRFPLKLVGAGMCAGVLWVEPGYRRDGRHGRGKWCVVLLKGRGSILLVEEVGSVGRRLIRRR
jgi:hypothetical protein